MANISNGNNQQSQKPSEMFKFYDTSSKIERTISLSLKTILDNITSDSYGSLLLYLYPIMHMPADPRTNILQDSFILIRKLSRGNLTATDQAVEDSQLYDLLGNIYTSPQSTERLPLLRCEVLKTMAENQLLKLENHLGIDGRGIAAQEARPLLGIQRKEIVAAYTYMEFVIKRPY